MKEVLKKKEEVGSGREGGASYTPDTEHVTVGAIGRLVVDCTVEQHDGTQLHFSLHSFAFPYLQSSVVLQPHVSSSNDVTVTSRLHHSINSLHQQSIIMISRFLLNYYFNYEHEVQAQYDQQIQGRLS